MDSGTLFWIFLVAGGLLAASELIVPGMVTIFLGIAAVLVALGYKTGILEGIISGVASWIVISLFSVFFIREMVVKLLPGDATFKNVDEDVDAYGSIVEVVEDVKMEDDSGRIKFRGTTWQATSNAKLIPAGSKARIVTRDNLVWIIETYEDYLLDEIELPAENDTDEDNVQ